MATHDEMGKMLVYKVELSTKKKVIFKKYLIKHNQMAAEAAARTASEGPAFQMAFNAELIKLLIVEIDGKKPDNARLEDLDSYFDMEEYTQLSQVVEQIAGNVKAKPKIELVRISGSK